MTASLSMCDLESARSACDLLQLAAVEMSARTLLDRLDSELTRTRVPEPQRTWLQVRGSDAAAGWREGSTEQAVMAGSTYRQYKATIVPQYALVCMDGTHWRTGAAVV